MTSTVTTGPDDTTPRESAHVPAITGPRAGSDDLGDRAPRCEACGHELNSWARDPLTGLWDRRGWDGRAQRIIESATRHRRPLALLLADVDRFKNINDALGHLAGDTVLEAVADVLRAATGADDLLGRYGGHGGDEFLILLPQAARVQAARVARTIAAGIRSRHVTVTATTGPVTVQGLTTSIGVAAGVPGADLSLRELIWRADTALLTAKTNGCDRIHATDLPAASSPW